VFGSSGLIPTLVAADLIDQYTLLVFPLVLGTGKRMFADDIAPTTLTLLGTEVSTSGVVVLRYGRGDRTLGIGVSDGSHPPVRVPNLPHILPSLRT
jgi:dihydrofolate reductase